MARIGRKLAALVAMVMAMTVAVQAGTGNGNDRKDGDDDRDSGPVIVTSAFVDERDETVTLRGLNFGRRPPVVFCETTRMQVLRATSNEVVVRFPSEVRDGTYLFTVARGNNANERGEIHVAKISIGSGDGSGERGPE